MSKEELIQDLKKVCFSAQEQPVKGYQLLKTAYKEDPYFAMQLVHIYLDLCHIRYKKDFVLNNDPDINQQLIDILKRKKELIGDNEWLMTAISDFLFCPVVDYKKVCPLDFLFNLEREYMVRAGGNIPDLDYCEIWLSKKLWNICGLPEYKFQQERRKLYKRSSYGLKHSCEYEYGNNGYVSNNMMKIIMLKLCDGWDDGLKLYHVFKNWVNFRIVTYRGETKVKKIQ